jgi:hypothetical protein
VIEKRVQGEGEKRREGFEEGGGVYGRQTGGGILRIMLLSL